MKKSEETDLTPSYVKCVVVKYTGKKTNIHSSNWKTCPCDSIIIMYLPCFRGVSATPGRSVQFDLQLMRLGLLMNVSFYSVYTAVGNVVMASFIICYDSLLDSSG